MDNKVYTPEIVPENPFPGGVEPVIPSIITPEGVYSPTSTQPVKPPKKRVATELLSTTLNTKSRKILQTFELQNSGGIQIGDFQEGSSGDVRITPNGLTARNLSGNTTFALDATTGDAVFSGDVRAATFTSDLFNVDADGNVIASSIKLMDENYKQVALGSSQIFTSSTPVDVDQSTFTIDLERPSILLFMVDALGWLFRGAVGDWSGNGLIRLYIDNAEKRRIVEHGHEVGSDSGGATGLFSSSIHYMTTLAAGTHTAKLTGAVDTQGGTPYFRLYQWAFSYIKLGNA